MASIDLHSTISVSNAMNVQTIGSNTTTVGSIVDTAGYESVEFVIRSGTITDGSYAVLVEDGDNSGLSDAAAVSDTFLLGTEAGAAFTASDDNEAHRIGYVGKKRYVRVSLVSTGVTTGGSFNANVVLGNAHVQPIAQ